MKKYFFITVFFSGLCSLLHPQLGNILKQKAGEGVEQGAEVSTEKLAYKIFSMGKNKKTDNDDQISQKGSNLAEKVSGLPDSMPITPGLIKAYSKYDFIPGEEIIAFDDFARDAVGDFPAQWTTNASGEIMTVDNYEGHWLSISKEGYYVPKFIKSLGDNFTLEYDLIFLPPDKSQGPNTAVVATEFITLTDSKKPFEYYTDRACFGLDPYMNSTNIGSYTKSGEKLLENQFNVKGLDRSKVFTYHIAVWRQKNRLRVYLNETKIIDAPSLLVEGIRYNTFRFHTSLNNDGSTWLISNFKLASGLADTRNKFMSVGKVSTTGILFGTNSSSILPQSYATLKDIAAVLKENADVKIKIVGHTDSDGDDILNLALSKKRAEAVKSILAGEFGIVGGRIETDGKGETQPAAPNTSPEGKAQNRRVEFIKM